MQFRANVRESIKSYKLLSDLLNDAGTPLSGQHAEILPNVVGVIAEGAQGEKGAD